MLKKIEIFGIIILIISGLFWAGFEIWLQKFADGTKLMQQGTKYAENKKFFKARLLLKLAVRKKINEAKISLLHLSISDKRPHDALYWLQQSKDLKIYHREFFALIIYDQLKQYDKVLTSFQKMKFNDRILYQSFIKRQIKAKFYDPTPAIEDYQEMAANGNKKVYPYLGVLLLAKGNEAIAVEYLKEAVVNNDYWSALRLGFYFFRMADYPQAITYYKKALSFGNKIMLGLDNKCVYLFIVNAYQRQKKYDKALEWCAKAQKVGLNIKNRIKEIKKKKRKRLCGKKLK